MQDALPEQFAALVDSLRQVLAVALQLAQDVVSCAALVDTAKRDADLVKQYALHRCAARLQHLRIQWRFLAILKLTAQDVQYINGSQACESSIFELCAGSTTGYRRTGLHTSTRPRNQSLLTLACIAG